MPGDKRGYIRQKTPTLLLSASSMEERWLSPLSCAVLRCIVHIALYSAALTNPEQVNKQGYTLYEPLFCLCYHVKIVLTCPT